MDPILSHLAEQHKLIDKKRRARALVLAIEWAGGDVRVLAAMVGHTKWSGHKWVARGQIPPLIALALVRIPGFPVPLSEAAAGLELDEYHRRQCPRCHVDINPPRNRTASLPLLKDSFKRTEQALKLREAALARLAAQQAKPKRKRSKRPSKPPLDGSDLV